MTAPVLKKTGGENIFMQVAVWGARGKPVVCIHGLTANCRCWDGIAEALSPKFQVVATDLRGRGVSERPSKGYSVLHHIEDLMALLDALGLERPAIMGHSLGALITLAFAALHPISLNYPKI